MKEYIAANQLPMDLQRRVIQWFDFAWRYKKDVSEEELFQQLNDNFRAEIAIHVNLDTLKKVKMFEHCDPSFLRELVLKLKPMLCSPGKTGFLLFLSSHSRVPMFVSSQIKSNQLTSSSVYHCYLPFCFMINYICFDVSYLVRILHSCFRSYVSRIRCPSTFQLT